MSRDPETAELSRFEQLRFAREVLQTEGRAVLALADELGDAFCVALDMLLSCDGNVMVTGIGKAGIIGQKITATLASTGTTSHFLHPSEAIHGDLGRVDLQDVVLALSFSGESEEIVRLLPHLTSREIPLVAITGNAASTLGRQASVTLTLGAVREACPLGLAPSTSTTAMLALGDAIALVLSRMHRFRAEDFARFHPGGSLGRKLSSVDEVMRPLNQCRIAQSGLTLREILVQAGSPGRRTGAIMLVDQGGHLAGIFTDSDLARLLEKRSDDVLTTPVSDVMTRSPRSIATGSRLDEAMVLLKEWKISELPVVDAEGIPLGLIDITDVVGLCPDAQSSRELRRSA